MQWLPYRRLEFTACPWRYWRQLTDCGLPWEYWVPRMAHA